MTLPAHLSGGYIAINLVDKINPSLELGSGCLLFAGLIGSVLPDIDFVFFKYMKDHHNSWPHTPLFWIAIYLIFFSIGIFLRNQIIQNYSTALIIGILTHLFLDWFNGRAAGIRIFYPFSEKLYSLFPLSPEKGRIPTFLIPNKEYVEFLKFYVQNKFLLAIEIMIIISGFGVWIFKKLVI